MNNNKYNPNKPSANRNIKNEKKERPGTVEALKEEEKKKSIFRKIKPYKRRQDERFETVKI